MMKRSPFPMVLLCGGLLAASHGSAAPLAPILPSPAVSLGEAAVLADEVRPAATVRVPSAAFRPLGAWRAGRALAAEDAQRLADALLREGAGPLGAELPAGTTSLILQLDHARPLRRCQLVNLNTRDGRITLAASAVQLPPESPRWRPAPGGSQALGDARGDARVQEWDLVADARYVRVEITLPQPGRIASLGMFERAAGHGQSSGQPLEAALPAPRRLVAALSLASMPTAGAAERGGGGQVVTVSAGEDLHAAGAMIDGDLTTGYRFRSTGGHGALTVFDLGRPAAPGRLTVSYRSGGATGKVDAYLLDELPARGEATAVRQWLAGRTPDASAPLTAGANDPRRGFQRAGLTLGERRGRFLALVFTATGGGEGSGTSGSGDFKDGKDRVDGKDFTGRAPTDRTEDQPGATDRGLQVVEITASGTDRFGPLLTSVGNLNTLPGSATGATFAPGSFFSPAGNFTTVSPGVDSAGPLLPPNFTAAVVTP